MRLLIDDGRRQVPGGRPGYAEDGLPGQEQAGHDAGRAPDLACCG